MERVRAAWKAGLRLLVAAAAVAVLVAVGLAVERYASGRERELAQQLIIHHFERSSWLALNAGRYAKTDPELSRRFCELAAWHARRAREFQRMNTGDVARESERNLEHDPLESRLMERALRWDARFGERSGEAAEGSETDGGDAHPTPPGLGPDALNGRG
jgi:hypothetical protein